MTIPREDPLDLRAAARSETGPRERNEDRFLVARLGPAPRILATSLSDADLAPPPGTVPGWLLAVADGMGGHARGDRASSVGLAALLRALPDPGLATDRLHEGLRRAFQSGARSVRGADDARDRKPMGTTLTATLVTASSMHLLHAGDSRAYLFRDGELRRLTRDHTLAQRLVERGAATEEELRRSPLTHQLVNSLGGGTEETRPDLGSEPLRAGDRILLCTDGLTGVLPEPEIAGRLRDLPDEAEAVDRLVERALELGTADNVTVVVARLARPS